MKAIISVTTTKGRLPLFFYSLQSLKKQRYSEYEIAINISSTPYLFDDGINCIPDWMSGSNISVNFYDNTGPYRKLVPIFNHLRPDDILITADDDILYSENWLTRILMCASHNPEAIVCGRAREIRKNIFGNFQGYVNWPYAEKKLTGLNLLPIGCSGVAYRKHLLDADFITDRAFQKYAPTTDDIWFRHASIRMNTPVVVDPEIFEDCISLLHNSALHTINLPTQNSGEDRISQFFSRAKYSAINRLGLESFLNYMGFAKSRNDRAWKLCYDYSKERMLNSSV